MFFFTNRKIINRGLKGLNRQKNKQRMPTTHQLKQRIKKLEEEKKIIEESNTNMGNALVNHMDTIAGLKGHIHKMNLIYWNRNGDKDAPQMNLNEWNEMYDEIDTQRKLDDLTTEMIEDLIEKWEFSDDMTNAIKSIPILTEIDPSANRFRFGRNGVEPTNN